jgi:hypothetical protein
VMLDTILLFIATFKVYGLSPSLFAESGMKNAIIGLVVFACITYGLKEIAYALPIVVQSLLFIGLLVVSTWAAWNFVLDEIDRGAIYKMANLKKILGVS